MALDYLSEIEVQKVELFLEDNIMREAVKKVILSGVYFDGTMEAGKPHDPLKNFVLGKLSQQQVMMNDDRHMGALARSMIDAVGMIETGFGELEKCKPVKVENKEVVNKGK